jgi:hypothetical protein
MSISIQHHCYTPRTLGAQRYFVAHNGVIHFNNSIGSQRSRAEDHGSLCMVVDGMGGLKNDRLAVEIAIQLFQQLYRFSPPHFDVDHLKQFVEQGHQEIRTSINQRNLPLMGCSIALLWFFEGYVMWLSIGNTKIYQQSAKGMRQISAEHSVSEFIERGWMSGESSEKLAQGWLFGCKIPNQAQHIFLAEGYDFGSLEMNTGDLFLIVNNSFDTSCSIEQRDQILRAPTLNPFPVLLSSEECCLITAHIQ